MILVDFDVDVAGLGDDIGVDFDVDVRIHVAVGVAGLGVLAAGEQPGRVFVGEASAPLHRQGSINVDQQISSFILDVTDGRSNAPAAVIKQADLLRKVCLDQRNRLSLRIAFDSLWCCRLSLLL